MAPNRTKPKHLAIVGAGPGGAMLAYLMARGGVPVTLFERHTDLSREFRGEGISPAGMDVFRQAGLLEAFRALPAAEVSRVELYAQGQRVVALDLPSILRQPVPIRVMPQPPLLEMLAEKASAFDGFEMRRGTLVRDVVREGGRVRGVTVGATNSPETVAADYVIGADGRYSTIRERLGWQVAGERQSFDVVWCKLPRPADMRRGTVYGLLLKELFALVLPADGDRIQIGRVIPKGSYPEFRRDGDGWFEKLARSLPPHLKTAFEASRDAVSPPVLLEVECGEVETWSAPGVCLMGDAAHPMSPVGAQGINIALRDAVVAANHFGPLLMQGADGATLDQAAKAIEAERRVEVDKIQAQQRLVPAQLRRATGLALTLKTIPDSWIGWAVRQAINSPMVQRYIRGVVDVKLTFGMGD
jgi:2-polyprenyl-6-methoxyphenol hydroxylase-like FAD-dependent oxidoreductase